MKRNEPLLPALDVQATHPRQISPKTAELYHGYVKSLRRAIIRKIGYEPDRVVRPTELVDHLLSRVQEIRPKTFINYRCGLVYWLSTLAPSDDVLRARLMLQTDLPKSGYLGSRPGTTSTLYSRSSVHRRTFARRNFDKLVAELQRRITLAESQKRGRPRAWQLLCWLRAGLASGLRPIEWETANWQNESNGELLVRTAKTKIGESALPHLKERPPKEVVYRVVVIDQVDRTWVAQHMTMVRRHTDTATFSSYYNNTRHYLWSVCRDIFGNDKPSQFTLYMMRGQFGANRKRLSSLDAVAAEMGCSPQIASTQYGSLRYAHRTGGPSVKMTHTATDRPSRPRP